METSNNIFSWTQCLRSSCIATSPLGKCCNCLSFVHPCQVSDESDDVAEQSTKPKHISESRLHTHTPFKRYPHVLQCSFVNYCLHYPVYQISFSILIWRFSLKRTNITNANCINTNTKSSKTVGFQDILAYPV